MNVLLAAVAALLYGAADFSGGIATRKSRVLSVLVVSQGCGLALAVAGSFLVGGAAPHPRDLLWGVAAGLFGAFGLALLYTAIASTLVSVASPVAAVTGAAIPVLAGVAFGERPSTLAWLGIAIVLPAILCLTGSWDRKKKGPADPPGSHGRRGREPDGREGGRLGPVGRAALLGAGAGIGFGLFYVAIARTDPATGLWPLVAARGATVVAVALVALGARRSLRPAPGTLGSIVGAGLLDMGANIAFLLASRAGFLSIAAVISSLYPAPTVLLARFVLRERLTPARWAGLACAVVAVALISA